MNEIGAVVRTILTNINAEQNAPYETENAPICGTNLSESEEVKPKVQVSNDKTFSMGLTTRPLSDTITTILGWEMAKESVSKRTTLSREKEQQLLDLWKKEQSHEI